MKLVPLIGYSKVDHEETRCTGTWDDQILRLWALVKFWQETPKKMVRKPEGGHEYVEQEPQLRTAEFCIKARGMFDFCGGMVFMSPQVAIRGAGGWGEEGFAHPGQCASIDTSWAAFKNEPDRAIDLEEFTGQKVWTAEEIQEYGFQCIAEACLASMLSRGTNGWTCSDALDGHMNQVHNYMVGYKERACTAGPPIHIAMIDKTYPGGRSVNRLYTRVISCTDRTSGTYYNSNSGNEVRIMVGSIDHKMDGSDCEGGDYVECPSCGEEHDMDCCNNCHNCEYDFSDDRSIGDSLDLSGQVGRVLNNPLYPQQARRYDWSNG